MRRIVVLLMIAASVIAPGAALADPPSDGCPQGWESWDTSAEPYQADNRADENGDGWVCARARGNQTATPPGGEEIQIYSFRDNDLPASDQ